MIDEQSIDVVWKDKIKCPRCKRKYGVSLLTERRPDDAPDVWYAELECGYCNHTGASQEKGKREATTAARADFKNWK